MKLQAKSLAGVLLPLILAGSAGAQVRMILPGGSNPFSGAPVRFPGPITPVSPVKIELPAPRLEPGLTLVLAPVTAALGVLPALPAPMIPSRPRVPVISPVASRENVRHPLSGLHPGLRAQLEAVKKDKKEDWRAELGAELFDGRLVPSRKRPVPVQPSVVIGLPEVELEKEIGAY